jgi:hypothetical protein
MTRITSGAEGLPIAVVLPTGAQHTLTPPAKLKEHGGDIFSLGSKSGLDLNDRKTPLAGDRRQRVVPLKKLRAQA